MKPCERASNCVNYLLFETHSEVLDDSTSDREALVGSRVGEVTARSGARTHARTHEGVESTVHAYRRGATRQDDLLAGLPGAVDLTDDECLIAARRVEVGGPARQLPATGQLSAMTPP